MKQVTNSGVCWFCDKPCLPKHYYHGECKDKFVVDNQ